MFETINSALIRNGKVGTVNSPKSVEKLILVAHNEVRYNQHYKDMSLCECVTVDSEDTRS